MATPENSVLRTKMRNSLIEMGEASPTALAKHLGFSPNSKAAGAVREQLLKWLHSGRVVEAGHIRGRPAYALAPEPMPDPSPDKIDLGTATFPPSEKEKEELENGDKVLAHTTREG
jgi:hypothetical protein